MTTNFNDQPWRPAQTNTLDDQSEAISDNSWQNLKNINYLINHNMVSRVASASNNIRHILTKSQKHLSLTHSNIDPRDDSASKKHKIVICSDQQCDMFGWKTSSRDKAAAGLSWYQPDALLFLHHRHLRPHHSYHRQCHRYCRDSIIDHWQHHCRYRHCSYHHHCY